MDKVSDSESGDCGFESHHDRSFSVTSLILIALKYKFWWTEVSYYDKLTDLLVAFDCFWVGEAESSPWLLPDDNFPTAVVMLLSLARFLDARLRNEVPCWDEALLLTTQAWLSLNWSSSSHSCRSSCGIMALAAASRSSAASAFLAFIMRRRFWQSCLLSIVSLSSKSSWIFRPKRVVGAFPSTCCAAEVTLKFFFTFILSTRHSTSPIYKSIIQSLLIPCSKGMLYTTAKNSSFRILTGMNFKNIVINPIRIAILGFKSNRTKANYKEKYIKRVVLTKKLLFLDATNTKSFTKVFRIRDWTERSTERKVSKTLTELVRFSPTGSVTIARE